MKTFTLNQDGSLTVESEGGARWEIQPDQIAAFRRDPVFNDELPMEIRVQLDGAGA